MSEFDEELDEIRVTETNQSDDSWTFVVELGRGDGMIEYMVDVDRAFWTRLTNRRIEPSELVLHTFKYLLEKEPKELILRRFNISDVSGHFPGFEDQLKRII